MTVPVSPIPLSRKDCDSAPCFVETSCQACGDEIRACLVVDARRLQRATARENEAKLDPKGEGLYTSASPQAPNFSSLLFPLPAPSCAFLAVRSAERRRCATVVSAGVSVVA